MFTASGPQSTPSRRTSAPSGLRPKQPPALDARSTCRGPTHTGLRSSANNRLSRHTLVLARRAASRREPQAEPELPRPLAWLERSLLLLGWWWWSSPSLVPQRSRPVRMSPTPIGKGFFSYTPPRLGIRFALGVRLYQNETPRRTRWRKTNFDPMICDALRCGHSDWQSGRYHVART